MIIAPSNYLARLAIAAGAPEGCVVVVPHAVDALPINPLRPSACNRIIVYAGLLSQEKGAPLLLDAFSQLATPGAELVYLGDGPARDAMEQRAQGSRVRFLGQVDAAVVAMSMSNARVLAHPSLIPEGFGLVGIEAMQLGRPVVGFGLGGSADWLVVSKTGLVAARQDAACLAAALDIVLTDGMLADRLGAAGRLLVREMYSAENVADELMAAMLSAMRVPQGRP
jgi:glycosyltransferase involved in cell wall biosynthesis